MDYPTEKHLLINPKTYLPEKAIWKGEEYQFSYINDWRKLNGELIVQPDFPMISMPSFGDEDPRAGDPAEIQQAAWDYIQTMKKVFEKAEKYDDLMGSGNA